MNRLACLPALCPLLCVLYSPILTLSLSHSLYYFGLALRSIQTVQQPSQSCARCINEWINIKEKHKSQLCIPRVLTWPHRPTNHVRGLGEKDGSFVVLARKRERERARQPVLHNFLFRLCHFPFLARMNHFAVVCWCYWPQVEEAEAFYFSCKLRGFPLESRPFHREPRVSLIKDYALVSTGRSELHPAASRIGLGQLQ